MERNPRDEQEERALRLLVASRPSPDPRFERELERRLVRHSSRRRLRPVFAGAATAGALAVAILIAGLAGGGPLSPSGSPSVEAEQDCRYVTVQKRERVPLLVFDRSGEPRIRYDVRDVERRVKRCR